MNILQLLGLRCRHTHKSRPFKKQRVCLSCGERFTHTAYEIEAGDRNSITHYEVKETSINKRSGLLRFKRKEGTNNG